MRSQMQIYPEVYKTQKYFLEKGAVVRINCIVGGGGSNKHCLLTFFITTELE